MLLEHFFFELLDELHFGVLKATADQDLEDGFCLQFEVEELVFAELGGDIDAFGLWLVLWSGLLIVIDLMVEIKEVQYRSVNKVIRLHLTQIIKWPFLDRLVNVLNHEIQPPFFCVIAVTVAALPVA